MQSISNHAPRASREKTSQSFEKYASRGSTSTSDSLTDFPYCMLVLGRLVAEEADLGCFLREAFAASGCLAHISALCSSDTSAYSPCTQSLEQVVVIPTQEDQGRGTYYFSMIDVGSCMPV